jgi:hypothetical protein
VLRDDVSIVFFSGAAQGFEDDYEEDYANARAGEGALRLDAP